MLTIEYPSKNIITKGKSQLARCQLAFSLTADIYIAGENLIFALIFGGDEENRTPVRKRRIKGFSERSSCMI